MPDKEKDPNGLADGSLSYWASRLYSRLGSRVNWGVVPLVPRWLEDGNRVTWLRIPVVAYWGPCSACGLVGWLAGVWAPMLSYPAQYACTYCDVDTMAACHVVAVNLD